MIADEVLAWRCWLVVDCATLLHVVLSERTALRALAVAFHLTTSLSKAQFNFILLMGEGDFYFD